MYLINAKRKANCLRCLTKALAFRATPHPHHHLSWFLNRLRERGMAPRTLCFGSGLGFGPGAHGLTPGHLSEGTSATIRTAHTVLVFSAFPVSSGGWIPINPPDLSLPLHGLFLHYSQAINHAFSLTSRPRVSQWEDRCQLLPVKFRALGASYRLEP